tara:strand:- start:64 stop:414 length:351 start_codon:yes stop_codon:yes gene_type:complete
VTEPGNALQSPVSSIITTSCKISNHKINKPIISRFCVKLIKGYRYFISPFLPSSCRFYPSCSQYALDSYLKLGFCKATYLSLLRLLKCNPFHPGGVDYVKDKRLSDNKCLEIPENN